ncbi:MAG: tetratricopeptide repeat protein [Candidatus Brocadiia bacterium]
MVDTESMPDRGIVLAVITFLALAILTLWWQRSENSATDGGDLTEGRGELNAKDEDISLSANGDDYSASEDTGRKKEMRRALQLLSSSNVAALRRSAALSLQWCADKSAEPGLLQSLHDEDEIVSRRCARALLNLWQSSRYSSIDPLFDRGVEATEAGHYQEAVDIFAKCAKLDPAIPDLYRLWAQALLERGKPREALAKCKKALEKESENFMAHYVLARCQAALGNQKEAREAVENALGIYPGLRYDPRYDEAIGVILSLGNSGG